ncbi:MAG: glutamate synthase-related protein [Methanobacteriaceae archaeon]|nr:glutamate synthase-related protein [Methanobacteriaceae archaeon]
MIQVPDTEENRIKCLCKKCPSYPHKCPGESLYCSRGSSLLEIREAGCLCKSCSVYFEYDLRGHYFCDKEFLGDAFVLMRKKKNEEDPVSYQKMVDIKTMAETGKSVVRSMGSPKKMPFSFDDFHFIPAQISKIPLNKKQNVKINISIGSKAKKPLHLSSPILISGMSYGAVSGKTRTVISHAAKNLNIGFNSGEGGVTKEEMEVASSQLIVQYSTGRFGLTEKILKKASAVEIRFGQGAYPGKGSYLPSDKINPEVAQVRNLKKGEGAYSPAHHPDMETPVEIKDKIKWIKKITHGVPVGAKIGCGNIEDDIKILFEAGVDFISIDGFGGGTGGTDAFVRENVGLPLIAALPRAAHILNKLENQGENSNQGNGASKNQNKVTLIAGGGLRTSADMAKCLALGADAVYLGTAALIAINCQQHRICHTGKCPTGITTHKSKLLEELNVPESIQKLENFIKLSNEEIVEFIRIIGKNDIHKLNKDDLISLNNELSKLAHVKWLI